MVNNDRISRSAFALAYYMICLISAPQLNFAQEVVRLSPSSFPQLPAKLASALDQLGCSVPQHTESSKSGNVINGEFAKPGQVDWAVLCSRTGHLELYVFWDGQPANREVVFSLQIPGPLSVPFESEIAPVDRKYILDHCRAGGAVPPPIDHQGIETSTGMSSGISYFYQGKWLILPGAD